MAYDCGGRTVIDKSNAIAYLERTRTGKYVVAIRLNDGNGGMIEFKIDSETKADKWTDSFENVTLYELYEKANVEKNEKTT